jgi:ABC-type antimicrobial peptide transport system permease subunit
MSSTTFNPDAGSFAIRTSGDPRTVIEPLRSIVREQDPFMTVSSLHSMEDRVSSSLARPRLYAVLLTTFALSALIIASVGVFGVLSYTVAQRTREIAVRTALGARRGDVVRLVFRQGFVLVATGLALGLVVSFAAARYLSTLLYGIAPHDWFSFAAVSLTIAIIAFIACLVPALRAARTDPLIAMRSA